MRKRLNKDAIIGVIRDIISYDYDILSEKYVDDGSLSFIIEDKVNNKIELMFYAKNITNAYLEYDPEVERIQIPVINSICNTTKNKCFLLMGIKNINDKDVLVCWDPKRYVHHNKRRSVYVNRSAIVHGYEDGYYSTYDHENKIYVCVKGKFHKVLKDYYADSEIKEFIW